MSKTQQRIKSATATGYEMALKGEYYKTRYLRGWFKAPYLEGCKKAIDEMMTEKDLNIATDLIFTIESLPRELAAYLKATYRDDVLALENAWVAKLNFSDEMISAVHGTDDTILVSPYDPELKTKLPGIDIKQHGGDAWLYYTGYYSNENEWSIVLLPRGGYVETRHDVMEIDTRTPHQQAADLSEFLKSANTGTIKILPIKPAILDIDVDMIYAGLNREFKDASVEIVPTKAREAAASSDQTWLHMDTAGIYGLHETSDDSVGLLPGHEIQLSTKHLEIKSKITDQFGDAGIIVPSE